MAEARILIARHGTKEAWTDGPKPAAGSPRDVTDVHLSEKGREEMRQMGLEFLGDTEYQHIVGIHSDHVRARESVEEQVSGYASQFDNPNDFIRRASLIPINGIGLSAFSPNGPVNWNPDNIPDYADKGPQADLYMIGMMEENFFARPGSDNPNIARLGANVFRALESGLVQLGVAARSRGVTEQAFDMSSHGGVLDTLAVSMADYLVIEPEAGTVRVDQDKYTGYVRHGEMVFTGNATDIETQNPTMNLELIDIAKGNRVVAARSYSMEAIRAEITKFQEFAMIPAYDAR